MEIRNKRKLESIFQVCAALCTSKTWAQLKQFSFNGVKVGIPKATLSRTLQELIQLGYVEAKVELDDEGHRHVTYFLLREPELFIKSKALRVSVKIKGEKVSLGTFGEGLLYKRRGRLLYRPTIEEKKRIRRLRTASPEGKTSKES